MEGVIGVLGLLFGITFLNLKGKDLKLERALEGALLAVSAAIPMLVLYSINRWSEQKRARGVMQVENSGDNAFVTIFVVRAVGFSVTFGLVLFFYWAINDYHFSFVSGLVGIDRRPLKEREIRNPHSVPFFHNFFRLFGIIFQDFCEWSIAKIIVAGLLYLLISQLLNGHNFDGYFAVGQAVLSSIFSLGFTNHSSTVACGGDTFMTTRDVHACNATAHFSSLFGVRVRIMPQEVLRHALFSHTLECIVRMFYAPLMFCSLCDNLPRLHYHGFQNFMDFFFYAQNLIFSIDLCFAFVGYISPAPFLSVEHTLLGWVSALACYGPFYNLVHDRVFNYLENKPWNEWFDTLNGNQNASEWRMFRAWGIAILVLQAAFAACTVSFGLHYSNLSYRTVVTTGPYYFLRHPAYVTKILSFALIHVPWVDVAALQQSVHVAKTCASVDCSRGDVGGIGIGVGGGGGASSLMLWVWSKVAVWTPSWLGPPHTHAYLWGGNANAARFCLSLAGFGLVYCVRAATEEAHLETVSGGLYAKYVGKS